MRNDKESDVCVPELYSGGERAEYNWRKINEGSIYFDIKYKGYEIDVMGINTDASIYTH